MPGHFPVTCLRPLLAAMLLAGVGCGARAASEIHQEQPRLREQGVASAAVAPGPGGVRRDWPDTPASVSTSASVDRPPVERVASASHRLHFLDGSTEVRFVTDAPEGEPAQVVELAEAIERCGGT